MTKTLKKSVAFLSAAVMVMAMLLYFPSETFRNIDWGLTVFAEENDYQPATLTTDKYDIDGDGTKDEVYEIGNAGQLYWFADKVNNYNETYGSANAVLTSDITVNSNVLTENGELNTGDFTSWTPIGTDNDYQYKGTFDGQEYKISGLYFNDPTKSNVGLFGYSYNATIKNVGVENSYLKGYLHVGGICGNNYSDITRCYFKGTVTANAYLGGVCGANGAKLTDCYNEGAVKQLYKDMYVSSGGVCGDNMGTISNCYNIGDVTGEAGVTCIGGVCGTNRETVSNCYNKGAVNGTDNVGGICGRQDYYHSGSGKTINCYNTGTVTATAENANVGGVCGLNPYVVENCYYLEGKATGGIEGKDVAGSAESKNDGEFSNGTVCGLVGYHSQFKNGFCGLCGNGYQPATETTDKYDIDNNGSKDTVYEIGNAGQLYWFAALVNGKLSDVTQNTAANAVLTDNITVNSSVLKSDGTPNSGNFTSWTPIGNNSNQYTGTFDGKNHTVSGLYFNDEDTGEVGLFGCLGNNTDEYENVTSYAKISNISVSDSYIKGNSAVGGIAGFNYYGFIINCNYKGTVIGNEYTGGVCGYNNIGLIIYCYNTGTVSGGEYIGGVCGGNDYVMSNSCNIGEVSGEDSVGGVCGGNNATIVNCYNTGTVSIVSTESEEPCIGGVGGYNYGIIANCYYNKDVCSKDAVGVNDNTVSENVLGKTTTQFKIGEVAYLLSQGCTIEEDEKTNTYDGSVWGQQIGTDDYPVLGGAKVYQNVSYEQCEGNPIKPTYSYENTQKATVYQEHSYVEGYCEWCRKPAHEHAAARYARTNVVESTCTEYGSYTRLTYCSCGQLMSTRYFLTLPKEHDYSSGGICKTCGALKNGKDGFKSASITLTDGVIINYNLILSDTALADTGAYIHFTSPQGLNAKIMLSEGVAENGKYKFSLKLRPDQMADVVTAQVVYSDGSKGNSVDYSVTKYAENQTGTADTKTSDLIDAMLYYGAATQSFTGNNADNSADENINKIFDSNVQISDDYKININGTVSGIKIKGASLIAGSLTTIRVKYEVTEGSISDFTFTCDGVKLAPVKQGDFYYIYIRDISPDQIDKMYSIVVTDKSGNSRTLNYSALTYAKSIIEDTTGKYPESLVNMMKALYYYNKAADAFSK